ncbi:hypothetical protein [Roseomonas marmotae]|uniref:Molecular chaperone DnaJ n=1 Tax=Roseomonas marmotae TaxID=2768161 RepID=A0ABS3K9K0_9PROT|nr:hypothetical protein [Roseomonas marmotae]MBO1073308.1 hypothetical protein [Roseomonas marmotae]QTI81051.1 hypothetical protein IAI58_15800 [Roseomonas marmotae]
MTGPSSSSPHGIEPLTSGAEKPGDDAPAGTPGTGDDICPDCQGSGRISGRTCETCSGTGVVTKGVGGA